MVENDNTIIIDTSTAHRTEAGWAYGYPELSKAHRDAIRTGKRIAVPGCYATGFITIAYPMVAEGILPKIIPSRPLPCRATAGQARKRLRCTRRRDVTASLTRRGVCAEPEAQAFERNAGSHGAFENAALLAVHL